MRDLGAGGRGRPDVAHRLAQGPGRRMTRLRDLGEEGLIRMLATTFRSTAGDLLVGAGEDDAAAWREGGGYMVASLDTMVEGVHFDFAWLRPREVGWRALAMAVNDLAAKGAQPLYGLVSLAAPADFEARRAISIAEGIAQMAEACGLAVAGGDVSATSGPVVITVSVVGRAEGPPRPRSSARPGWQVAVTGCLGAAAAGLRAARAGQPLDPAWEAALRRPLPRVGEGRDLAAADLCCGDISDGLHRELVKFRAMARVGARLNLGAVP